MFRKIIEILKNKNKQKEEKICWPSNWDYEAVQNFNAMLMGMALEKTG